MNANPKQKDREAARPETSNAPRVPVDLFQATQNLLQECRMVLPGIQALFGFQLIAVFSRGFPALPPGLKILHLAATVLNATAIALVMAPAAYQRLVSPMSVSVGFVRRSSRLLLASMFPLAASLCADLYVVARVMLDSAWMLALSLALFALFMTLWVLLPARDRRAGTDTR